MTARATSSGTITFGMVAIPVKLYSCGDSTSKLEAHYIHKGCGSRLKQEYKCLKDGQVVESHDRDRGYEVAKDQYVVFTAEELKALESASDGIIKIVKFVPETAVDRIYRDKPWYLGPDRGGEQAYQLLRAAMERTKLRAVGQYTARGKQYLALLTPHHNGLMLEQLKYQHEVRAMDGVPVGTYQPKEEEIKMGVALIEQLSDEEFNPEEFKDEGRERILSAIEAKKQGLEVVVEAAPAPAVVDLMAALKQSLATMPEKRVRTRRTANT